jgi:hypothetical protein
MVLMSVKGGKGISDYESLNKLGQQRDVGAGF